MKKNITAHFFCLFLLSFLAFPCNASDHDQTIPIASFNLEIFGKSKSSKPEVMCLLALIISRYDLVAVQVIRDKNNVGFFGKWI